VTTVDVLLVVCHCQEIDEYVEKAKDQSCATLIALGSRGFAFATNLILSTAAKVVLMRRKIVEILLSFFVLYMLGL